MDNLTAQQALDDYYADKYFGKNAMIDKWVWFRLGPIQLPAPNLKGRREVIHVHDLHHILTGYDNSWTGEGEIAAWELATGFPGEVWVAYLYAPITFFIGLAIAPKRIWVAWCRGWGHKNLLHLRMEKSELLKSSVQELKRKIGLV